MAKMYVAVLDNVFVKETEQERDLGGGFIAPITMDRDFTFGTVISVGEGTFEHGNYIPVSVRVGDEIVFPKTMGTSVTFNGDKILMIKSSDVIAVLKDIEQIIEGE